MDKQSTVAFVLIGIIMVVWMVTNQPEPVPQDTLPDSSTIVESEKRNSYSEPQKEIEEKIAEPEKLSESSDESTFNNSKAPERIITIETNLVRMELSSYGGQIKKYFLKKYNTWYDKELGEEAPWYKQWVQLINKNQGELNLLFVTKDGKRVHTGEIDFSVEPSGHYFKVNNDDSLSLAFTYKVADNKEIVKTYTFFGNDYITDLDIELKGMDDVISGYRYDLLWESGLNFTEKNSTDESNYTKASAFTADELFDIDATSVDEKEIEEFNGKVDWIGTKIKYFGLIIAPEKPSTDGGAYIEGSRTENQVTGPREKYSISLQVPFNERAYQKDEFEIYLGPMDYDRLKSYGNKYEVFYDFGSFMGLSFITRPISEYVLLPLFKFLHQFIPNYGWVIIIFSLLIKIPLWPLTKQSYKSMKRMSMLQPKITALKEQYKDDPQRVQKETMAMYSKYGVNPMGGCLTMLPQLPIIAAMFTLFQVNIDLRHAEFIWWIDNLSSPDILFRLPFTIPILGNHISGVAFFMGAMMFIQQRMTMKDPQQKAMMYMMPVMMTLMFNSFPSGLNLYYSMFNLFSILQQQIVNKTGGAAELVPVEKKKRKKGFMQKMMDAAEQKQKEQQNAMKKQKKGKR